MKNWHLYLVGAAFFYGMHQVFTKMASDKIGDGIGSAVVEGTAFATILTYLLVLWSFGRWNQNITFDGVAYSALTGVCVGIGTIFFFLLFQKGAPLLVVPTVLALGCSLMVAIGIVFFKEPASLSKILGIALSILGLILLKR